MNPLKCIQKGQSTCGGQFAISDLDFIETENYPDENYHNDMACSWEIDAQGSYGLYLNMIIYRVDANEDTKYNHFAYYTNQDRKSKRYLRFGKPKNLVCSLTLSIFELGIFRVLQRF